MSCTAPSFVGKLPWALKPKLAFVCKRRASAWQPAHQVARLLIVDRENDAMGATLKKPKHKSIQVGANSCCTLVIIYVSYVRWGQGISGWRPMSYSNNMNFTRLLREGSIQGGSRLKTKWLSNMCNWVYDDGEIELHPRTKTIDRNWTIGPIHRQAKGVGGEKQAPVHHLSSTKCI